VKEYPVRKALLALATSSVLALGLAAPAQAAPPPFEKNAEKAVSEVDPTLRLSESAELESESSLDPAQTVKIDDVTFRGSGKVVSVLRSVGAVRKVTSDTTVGRVLQKKKVKRAKAGARDVLISSTADRYGPGLTIATWTERTGVNYQVISRDGLDRAGLLKVVKALPADDTKASRKARRAVESAPPARKRVESRSASSLYVDGAGTITDDWGDEGTLCNGCSYSNSNYTFMWQKVLWADNRLAAGAVDCSFGSQTASATVNWQNWMGVSADGIVGATTRGRADNYLSQLETESVRYAGYSQIIYFTRNSSNNRYMFNGRYFGYTYTTLC